MLVALDVLFVRRFRLCVSACTLRQISQFLIATKNNINIAILSSISKRVSPDMGFNHGLNLAEASTGHGDRFFVIKSRRQLIRTHLTAKRGL